MFDPARVAGMAQQLEDAGFDGAYTFEGQSDPFITVAAAAMNSERMELMTSIAVAFSRNPMNLAYLGNDLQNLSEGRFILGLGAQVKAHIERRFSMPWSKPAARMREMVLAVRTIWDCWQTGEKLKFEGEFYNHTLMSPVFSPQPNEYGPPPIFIAGVGPLMTEVAAEVGDGYFLHPFNTAKSMEELSLAAIQRGLDKAGKERDGYQVSAQVITATGLDDESMQMAVASARNQIAFYASTPAYLPVLECHGWEHLQKQANTMMREGKWAELNDLIDDDMLNTFAVVGTPAEVAVKIKDRFHGKVERISPVVYQPDVELLAALRGEIAAVC
ncbi:TIGR03617 family F420-dependent LLM class oxidoreductase [Halioglobus maricola]|uniref:TIGR03617 family F420-dependent LLM class oxidoreductase n=2 Tax=Halioglobus maricola TaxID=2601894 RepID=A0A5P9NQ55_9GAMM|nr:TIGR03617 family F420-dependent LLM class oxidoreductase [Halioglobus maricola]